jgi:hypothetical protein
MHQKCEKIGFRDCGTKRTGGFPCLPAGRRNFRMRVISYPAFMHGDKRT